MEMWFHLVHLKWYLRFCEMIAHIRNNIELSGDKLYLRVSGDTELLYRELYTPFERFKRILSDITGFDYPSGVAFISDIGLIENMYIAQYDEASLYDFDIDKHNRVIVVNNFAGPEGYMCHWKGLTQRDLESAFQCQFDNNVLSKFLEKFPNNLTLHAPA